MKLAVFFPGIGYTNDKPLLYYSRKLAKEQGYEELCVSYHDLPAKVKGDKELMQRAIELAYNQACEYLSKIDFGGYSEILMVGKSIGTVLATRYVDSYNIKAKLVLYTPVEATFDLPIDEAVAFIGDADPWSTLGRVEQLAKEREVKLYLYPKCNHSLECEDTFENIKIVNEVMSITEQFITCSVTGTV